MRSKTYRAKTMKEALTRVRRDLGGDALILSAREVRRRRLFGMGPQLLVEVIATDAEPVEREVKPRPGPAVAIAPARSAVLQARVGEELGRLHAMVETLSRNGHIDHLLPELPSSLVPTYAQLVEADVPEVLARRLVRHIAENLEPDQYDHPEAIRRRSAMPSSSVSRLLPRSRRSPARAGSSLWWARRASARRQPSPSWRPTSSWLMACGSD